jgi:hypothetical protein
MRFAIGKLLIKFFRAITAAKSHVDSAVIVSRTWTWRRINSRNVYLLPSASSYSASTTLSLPPPPACPCAVFARFARKSPYLE